MAVFTDSQRVHRLAKTGSNARALNARLSRAEVSRGEPTRVLVHLKGDAGEAQRLIASFGLSDIAAVVAADYSLAELVEMSESIPIEVGDAPFDLAVDVDSNRIQIRTPSHPATEAYFARHGGRIPDATVIVPVTSQAEPMVDVKAGDSLLRSDGTGGCTVGFAATDNTNGQKGIITAGHCPPDEKLAVSPYTTLPFVREQWGGRNDVQFHSANGTTPRPVLKTGTSVVGVYEMADTYVGMVIYKYGQVSGSGSAVVDSLVYRPTWFSADAKFVHARLRKSPSGTQYCVKGGDSGGPVYFVSPYYPSAGYAMGVLSGGDNLRLFPTGDPKCQTAFSYSLMDYTQSDLRVSILQS